jgi:hypothetical protein
LPHWYYQAYKIHVNNLYKLEDAKGTPIYIIATIREQRHMHAHDHDILRLLNFDKTCTMLLTTCSGAKVFRPALVEFVKSLLVFCEETEALRRKVHDQNLLAKTPLLGEFCVPSSPIEKRV